MGTASDIKGIATFARCLAPLRIRRFWSDETGSLVIFALMLAMLMMMMGGIAVDVMRYESRRTSLQNTLDRSTLAAASMTQGLEPEAVVDDYFLKAGLADFLTSVTVTEGMNFTSVSATAEADTEPFFLHLMGIDEFNAPGISSAEQRITNVEIMLVLDVSGSMGNNSKLTNLKTAARNFVDTVLVKDVEDKISIGIVPFNGQVNLGPTLIAELNAVYPHGTPDVNCVDLPPEAYDTVSIAQYAFATSVAPDELSMTADADTYSGYSGSAPSTANKWCPPQPGNIVRLPSQDIDTLKGYIDGLTAIGATSINAGMRWGIGLLDPTAREIYSGLIDDTAMVENLEGRPFEYDDPEAMKVIVLMTDGEHFAEERVNDAYKSGPSSIYKSNEDSRYSIFHDTATAPNQYYVPHLNTWQAQPWTNDLNTGTATQQTWPEVWKSLRVQYVAQNLYAVPLSYGNSSLRTSIYSNILTGMKTQTATSAMNDQLQSVCDLAKENQVIVYGIAFEAPANGQTQIRNCSTDSESGTYYFDAAGTGINTAFNVIANNISQLRLTQ